MNDFEAADFSTSSNSTDFLGRGSFASVRRCHHQHLGNVVVKCFFVTGSDVGIDKNIQHMQNEAKVLCRIEHENIIKVFGITKWSTCYGLVMEEAAGYNLEDLIIQETDKDIPWPLRGRFFKEIADGIDYLHNHDPKRAYIHGDLKPQNILLTDRLGIKIADFGAVNIIQVSGASTASFSIVPCKQYTWTYSAPELLKNPEARKTKPMDMYSYALIGYEIITRRQVFVSTAGASCDLIRKLIMENGQKPDSEYIKKAQEHLFEVTDLSIFSNLHKTVSSCWHYDPKSRSTVTDVKRLLNNIEMNDEDMLQNFDKLKKPTPSSSTCSLKVSLDTFEPPFRTISRKSNWNATRSLSSSSSCFDQSMNDLTVKQEEFLLDKLDGYFATISADQQTTHRSSASTPTRRRILDKKTPEASYPSFQQLPHSNTFNTINNDPSSPLQSSARGRVWSEFDNYGLSKNQHAQNYFATPPNTPRRLFYRVPSDYSSQEIFEAYSPKSDRSSNSPNSKRTLNISRYYKTGKTRSRSSEHSHLSLVNNSSRERFEIHSQKSGFSRSSSFRISPFTKQDFVFPDPEHPYGGQQFSLSPDESNAKSTKHFQVSKASPKKSGLLKSLKQVVKNLFKKNKSEKVDEDHSQKNVYEKRKTNSFTENIKDSNLNQHQQQHSKLFASTSKLNIKMNLPRRLSLELDSFHPRHHARSVSGLNQETSVERKHPLLKQKLSLPSSFTVDPRSSRPESPFSKAYSPKRIFPSSSSSFSSSQVSSKSSLFFDRPIQFHAGPSPKINPRSSSRNKTKLQPIYNEVSKNFSDIEDLQNKSSKNSISPDKGRPLEFQMDFYSPEEIPFQSKQPKVEELLTYLSQRVSLSDSRKLFHNCSNQSGIDQHEFLEEAFFNCTDSAEYFLRICSELNRIHGDHFNSRMLLEHFSSKHGNPELVQLVFSFIYPNS